MVAFYVKFNFLSKYCSFNLLNAILTELWPILSSPPRPMEKIAFFFTPRPPLMLQKFVHFILAFFSHKVHLYPLKKMCIRKLRV